MITISMFDASGCRKIEDPDQISELIKGNGNVVWADLQAPTDDELTRVGNEFGLHPLAIEDARKHGQRPKLEVYEDHGFLVAYGSSRHTEELKEIDTFVGPNWLITVHDSQPSARHFDMDVVRERCARTLPKNLSVAFVLYTLLDETVDSLFDAIDRIGEKIDHIEERIFADDDPEADERPTQRDMLEVRKELLMFRRRVVPMREVLLMLLRDDLAFIDRRSYHYFQDVLDHVMRITDEIDNRRELIGNAVDAHLAMVSNQMNETMKKMTSWGAILIVSTLISGIFGMNFKQMDLLDSDWGFRGILVFMVAVTVGLYAFFKRKQWI